jgi:hypothetical protein
MLVKELEQLCQQSNLLPQINSLYRKDEDELVYRVHRFAYSPEVIIELHKTGGYTLSYLDFFLRDYHPCVKGNDEAIVQAIQESPESASLLRTLGLHPQETNIQGKDKVFL